MIHQKPEMKEAWDMNDIAYEITLANASLLVISVVKGSSLPPISVMGREVTETPSLPAGYRRVDVKLPQNSQPGPKIMSLKILKEAFESLSPSGEEPANVDVSRYRSKATNDSGDLLPARRDEVDLILSRAEGVGGNRSQDEIMTTNAAGVVSVKKGETILDHILLVVNDLNKQSAFNESPTALWIQDLDISK